MRETRNEDAAMQSYNPRVAKKINIIDIPYIPDQIDLDDLEETDGKLMLLPEKHIKQIRSALEKETENKIKRYRKNELKQLGLPTKYSIVKLNGKYYAIYKGLKENKALGKGYFGVVKIAQNLETGEWVALKIQSCLRLNDYPERIPDTAQQVKQRGEKEFQMLAKTGQTQGAFESVSASKGYQYSILATFTKGTELFIYCKKLKERYRNLPTVKWLQIAIGICKRIENLHDCHQLIHRDIKSENFIYYSVTDEVGLVDFGHACPEPDNNEGTKHAISISGTVGFIAPEIYEEGKYSKKSDTYAIGMCLLELLNLGFFTPEMHMVIDCEDDQAFKNNKHIRDDTARKLILRFIRNHLIARDPAARPEVREISQFLTAIQNRYLSLPSRTVIVGILNLDEYKKFDKFTRLEMQHGLKKFDRIILVDKRKCRIKKYILLRRELTENGITVENKVVPGRATRKTIATVPEWMESNDSLNIYCYFHVTRKTYKKSLEEQRVATISPTASEEDIAEYFSRLRIYPSQYQSLQKNLQDEIVRLRMKNNATASAHADLLEKTLLKFEHLYKSSDLHYQSVYSRLIEIENQAPTTHAAGNFFAKSPVTQPHATAPDLDRKWQPS